MKRFQAEMLNAVVVAVLVQRFYTSPVRKWALNLEDQIIGPTLFAIR